MIGESVKEWFKSLCRHNCLSGVLMGSMKFGTSDFPCVTYGGFLAYDVQSSLMGHSSPSWPSLPWLRDSCWQVSSTSVVVLLFYMLNLFYLVIYPVYGTHFHCLIVFSMLDILIHWDPNRHFYSESPRYCFDKRVCVSAFSLALMDSSYSRVMGLTPGAWPCGVLTDRMGCPLQSCLTQKSSVFCLLGDPILLHFSKVDASKNFCIFSPVPFAV